MRQSKYRVHIDKRGKGKQNQIHAYLQEYNLYVSKSNNAKCTGIKLPIVGDPNKVISVQILVQEIRNQPRLRLIRLSKMKLAIPLVQMGLEIPPRPNCAIHMKQVLGS